MDLNYIKEQITKIIASTFKVLVSFKSVSDSNKKHSDTPKYVPFDIGVNAHIVKFNSSQLDFFNYVKLKIETGDFVDIYNDETYIIKLAETFIFQLHKTNENLFKKNKTNERYKILDKSTPFDIDNTISNLNKLNEFYPRKFLLELIGDTYCFGGNFNKAMEYYTLACNDNVTRNYMNYDEDESLIYKLWNIKIHLGLDADIKEILKFHNKFTKFGIDNIDYILPIAETIFVDNLKNFKDGYLRHFCNFCRNESWTKIGLFGNFRNAEFDSDEIFYSKNSTFKYFYFFQNSELRISASEISRTAENLYRNTISVPNVGEGWVAETELYNKIKSHTKNYDVIQHARPKWLGKQHLDVFIPELNLAFEFHGKQHFEPVPYFGGQEAFEKNLIRDNLKREKCKANNITLIELQEGYQFETVIKCIQTAIDNIN